MLAEAEPPEALRMLRAGYVDVALVFRHYQAGADAGAAQRGRGGTRGRLLLDEPVHLVTGRPPRRRTGRRTTPGGAPAAAAAHGDLAAYASTAGSLAASGAAAT